MKIYISGPITGTDDYMNRFCAAEEKAKKIGYEVVNPAKVNAMLPESTEYEDYMTMSMVMLDMCDAICMMHGWKESKGAMREYNHARNKGIAILSEDDVEKLIEGKEEMKKGYISQNFKNADYYGYEVQSGQLIEECAELIQAVNKLNRAKGKGQTIRIADAEKELEALSNLKEEIADVEVMIAQIKYLLDIKRDEIEEIKEDKVYRTADNIKKLEAKKKGLYGMYIDRSRV